MNINDINKIPWNVLSTEAYIIYLRKSRTDNPDESVEEVLSRHEADLQKLAVKELGGMIPEHCIFREIVSGETIDERPEIQKVLSLIENPAVKMVLVVEPARLSRGDLEDCGRMVNALRYTNTKVMTLNMTYDLSNKMHRKFFEQELMRGNDFLEYTKEILYRGRIRSVERGNYIGRNAPFGYDKVMVNDEPTLTPNENAEAVRLVFDMYVNQGKTYLQIARHLDSIGVKPTQSEIWEKSSISMMLRNIHYIGKVRFGAKSTTKTVENGKVIKKRSVPSSPEDIIIADGRHPAIVTKELFDAAQEKMNNNPRRRTDLPLKNPLAGLMFCSKCGRAIVQHPYPHAKTRYECRNRNGCGSKSAPMDEVIDALLFALEHEQLPELEAKLKNNAGSSAMIQQKQLQAMRKELEELKQQETKQFELLEKGIYSEDLFVQRNKALHNEMEELKSKIFEVGKAIPKEVDYKDKIVKLNDAISALRNPDLSPAEKNKFAKAIIDKIVYEYIAYEGKCKVRYKLHVYLLV